MTYERSAVDEAIDRVRCDRDEMGRALSEARRIAASMQEPLRLLQILLAEARGVLGMLEPGLHSVPSESKLDLHDSTRR